MADPEFSLFCCTHYADALPLQLLYNVGSGIGTDVSCFDLSMNLWTAAAWHCSVSDDLISLLRSDDTVNTILKEVLLMVSAISFCFKTNIGNHQYGVRLEHL